MLTDDEILTLRVTVVGGKKWPDDYTVIWRTLPIGRIMLAPGLSPHVQQRRWTCNFYDLDDCKRQFKAAWALLRAVLTDADIALPFEMRR